MAAAAVAPRGTEKWGMGGGVAGWGDGESQSVTMAMGKTGEDVGKRERVCVSKHTD